VDCGAPGRVALKPSLLLVCYENGATVIRDVQYILPAVFLGQEELP